MALVVGVVLAAALLAWNRSRAQPAVIAPVPARVAPTNLKVSVAGFRKAIEYDNLAAAQTYLSVRCKAELGPATDGFLQRFKTGDETAFQFSSFVEHPLPAETASLVDYRLDDGPITGSHERWVQSVDQVWYFDACTPAVPGTETA